MFAREVVVSRYFPALDEGEGAGGADEGGGACGEELGGVDEREGGGGGGGGGDGGSGGGADGRGGGGGEFDFVVCFVGSDFVGTGWTVGRERQGR